MGVQSLTSYVAQNHKRLLSQISILTSSPPEKPLVLLVDYYCFVIHFSQQWNVEIIRRDSWNSGDYQMYHQRVTEFVGLCRSLNVQLIFFKDGEEGADMTQTEEERQDPEKIRQKFESGRYLVWKSRYEDKIKRWRKQGDLRISHGNNLLNLLQFPMVLSQFAFTLESLGVQVEHCIGEADHEMIRYARTHFGDRKAPFSGEIPAYAILSSDSDFYIYPNTCFVNIDSLSYSPSTGISFSWIHSTALASAVNLTPLQLIDLAGFCGNDVTKPLLPKVDFLSWFGLVPSGSRAQDCLELVHLLGAKEKTATLKKVFFDFPKFKEAFDKSRESYLNPPQVTLKPVNESDHFLLDEIACGSLPTTNLGLVKGIYFPSPLYEEVNMTGSGLDSILLPLLEASLRILRLSPVCGYVRSFDSFKCVVVNPSEAAYPSFAEIKKLSTSEKWQHLAKAAGFLSEDLSGPLLSKDPATSLPLTTFLAVLQLLVAINENNPGLPMSLSRREMFALIATFLDTINQEPVKTEPFFKSDRRSHMILLKFERCYRGIKDLASILLLSKEIQAPHHFFSRLAFFQNYQKFVNGKAKFSLDDYRAEPIVMETFGELLSSLSLDIFPFDANLEGVDEMEEDFDEEALGEEKAEVSLTLQSLKPQIIRSLQSTRITCIRGDTGSGKSSQLPQIILDSNLSKGRQLIFVTQPRRIAAVNLAQYVSKLRGEKVGKTVGYRIGSEQVDSKDSKILYVTVGYLLRLLIHHPDTFSRISHIILDEVHERGVDNDFLSLLIKNHFESTPDSDLRLVIMSATIQLDIFANYFLPVQRGLQTGPGDIPIITLGGKPFPVEIVYLDAIPQGLVPSAVLAKYLAVFKREKPIASVDDALVDVVIALLKSVGRPGRSTLVFLPGLPEIEKIAEKLDQDQFETLILHSQIALEDQLASFSPLANKPRVILATNMAESSVTLPDVDVVIDIGMEKEMAFDDRLLVHRLFRKWVSKASAKQRAGRTGRICPGRVFRLYPETFFECLPHFATSEVQRTPLEHLLLQAKVLEIGIPTEVLLRTIDAPAHNKVDAALTRLFQTGAISSENEDFELTSFGLLCSCLPLDLLQSKLVFYGILFHVPLDAVVLAAAISSQDVFTMPSTAISKSLRDYVSHARENFRARVKFDRQQLSEPLMYLNVYKGFMGSNKSSDFAHRHSIHLKRANHFCISVSEIASRVHSYCKQRGLDKANPSVFSPLVMLYEKKAHFDRAPFTESMSLLKFLLAITFDRNLLKCAVSSNKNFSKPQKNLSSGVVSLTLPETLAHEDSLKIVCEQFGITPTKMIVANQIGFLDFGPEGDNREIAQTNFINLPFEARLLGRFSCHYKFFLPSSNSADPEKIETKLPSPRHQVNWEFVAKSRKGKINPAAHSVFKLISFVDPKDHLLPPKETFFAVSTQLIAFGAHASFSAESMTLLSADCGEAFTGLCVLLSAKRGPIELMVEIERSRIHGVKFDGGEIVFHGNWLELEELKRIQELRAKMNFSFEMNTVASKLTPIFLNILHVLETRFREHSSSPNPLVGELTWVNVPMTFSSFSEETENLGNHLPDLNIQSLEENVSKLIATRGKGKQKALPIQWTRFDWSDSDESNLGFDDEMDNELDDDEVNDGNKKFSSPESGDLETRFFALIESNPKEAIQIVRDDPRFNVNANSKSHSSRTPLHFACLYDHSDLCALLLANPQIAVNPRDSLGWTPIHCACAHGSSQSLSLLLADPRVVTNRTNSTRATPFWLAAAHGRVHELRQLLASRRKITDKSARETVGAKKCSPLEIALEKGHDDAVALLKSFKESPSQTRASLRLELPSEAREPGSNSAHNQTLFDKLPEIPSASGASMDNPESQFFSVAKTNAAEALKIVQETPKFNVNARDFAKEKKRLKRGGNSPLHLACKLDDPDLCIFLLSHPQINVNIPNSLRFTPLHIACSDGALRSLDLLLADPRVDLNAVTIFKSTPFWTAAAKGKVEVIRRMMTSGRDFDMDKKGSYDSKKFTTPLEIATQQGHDDVVALLRNISEPPIRTSMPLQPELRKEAGVQETNSSHDQNQFPKISGDTDNAAEAPKIVQETPSQTGTPQGTNASPNQVNVNGSAESQFYAAIKKNVRTALKIVLETPEFDVNCKEPRGGDAPLHLACKFDFTDLCIFLLAHPRIDVNIKDSLGFTPLHTACSKGALRSLDLLLADPRVDLDAVAIYQTTPLWIAAERGNVKVIRRMMTSGRDFQPGIKGSNGGNKFITPLEIATQKGHNDVVVLLRNISEPPSQTSTLLQPKQEVKLPEKSGAPKENIQAAKEVPPSTQGSKVQNSEDSSAPSTSQAPPSGSAQETKAQKKQRVKEEHERRMAAQKEQKAARIAKRTPIPTPSPAKKAPSPLPPQAPKKPLLGSTISAEDSLRITKLYASSLFPKDAEVQVQLVLNCYPDGSPHYNLMVYLALKLVCGHEGQDLAFVTQKVLDELEKM